MRMNVAKVAQPSRAGQQSNVSHPGPSQAPLSSKEFPVLVMAESSLLHTEPVSGLRGVWGV